MIKWNVVSRLAKEAGIICAGARPGILFPVSYTHLEPEIEEIPSYFDDPVVNSMFFSYLEYRKEKGKEVKGKAIGYCIDKLESLSNSPVEQVAIIKQTIQNGWTDFFPLKGKKEKVSGSNVSSWLEREKIKSTGGVFGD